jgi:hypothetical protein
MGAVGLGLCSPPHRAEFVVCERAAGVGFVLQVLALQPRERILGNDLAVDGPVEEAREVFPDVAGRARLALGDETVEQLVHVAAADVSDIALVPFGIDVEFERALDLAPALDVRLGVLVDEALGDGLDRVRVTSRSGDGRRRFAAHRSFRIHCPPPQRRLRIEGEATLMLCWLCAFCLPSWRDAPQRNMVR